MMPADQEVTLLEAMSAPTRAPTTQGPSPVVPDSCSRGVVAVWKGRVGSEGLATALREGGRMHMGVRDRGKHTSACT